MTARTWGAERDEAGKRSVWRRTERVRAGLQAGWKVGTLVAQLWQGSAAPVARSVESLPPAGPSISRRTEDDDVRTLHRQYAEVEVIRLKELSERVPPPPPVPGLARTPGERSAAAVERARSRGRRRAPVERGRGR